MAKSIKEIELEFREADEDTYAFLVSLYGDDIRVGVRNAAKRARTRLDKLAAEKKRVQEMLRYEREYGASGICCGIDEAGRGPLAGPVVAAAVILPKDCELLYVNDSKQLSAAKREQLFEEIKKAAVSYGIGIVGPERIDEINILQADYEAMRQAVSALNPVPDVLLNDAVTIPGLPMQQVNLVHGDAKSLSIAAASILAKVTRDRMMEEYDKLYPEYGFAGHKGYGSAEHIEKLKKYGPCPIHRRSFIGHFVPV